MGNFEKIQASAGALNGSAALSPGWAYTICSLVNCYLLNNEGSQKQPQ
jgi:hypothetical protein